MIIQSDKYKAGIMALGDELAKETDQKGKDDILEKISDHTQSTSVYVSDDVFIDRIYEEISGL